MKKAASPNNDEPNKSGASKSTADARKMAKEFSIVLASSGSSKTSGPGKLASKALLESQFGGIITSRRHR